MEIKKRKFKRTILDSTWWDNMEDEGSAELNPQPR